MGTFSAAEKAEIDQQVQVIKEKLDQLNQAVQLGHVPESLAREIDLGRAVSDLVFSIAYRAGS